MNALEVTNCHAERVYYTDPSADPSGLFEVINDIDPGISWVLTEDVGVCLAADDNEYSCNRLAFHDGPHGYIAEDKLVTFEVCHCGSVLGIDTACWHYQDYCSEGPHRILVHPAWAR